ncbi:hypothetical protein PAAG_08042 [Paracoccidioides lutzii Pb01]|uniref:Uncharacterized protein n=1 Tax=Paracoccidioides lutzii (strain ATCC MYA-826 / Pb01) TaxID=502779 RepID=C1HBA1_PARBA|nr:hypothetical protein PAAG_08042 [Paracoccidioides lutzii Pb01]EEH37624.2 hypothetical protein PAAG_08042 [Paracoccidioides lutzii Pb01]
MHKIRTPSTVMSPRKVEERKVEFEESVCRPRTAALAPGLVEGRDSSHHAGSEHLFMLLMNSPSKLSYYRKCSLFSILFDSVIMTSPMT